MYAYILLSALVVNIGAWSYNDVNHWPDTCRGTNQSPINVDRKKTTYDKTLADTPLKLSGFDSATTKPIVVSNNGHSSVFTLDGGETKYMEGGDLATTTYRLVQFHFHWGGHSTVGSEHTFDSYRFPMEVHFVFLRNDIPTLSAALNISKSLAVLGVFFEIGDVENTDYTSIITTLESVKYKGGNTTVTGMKLGSLLPNHDHTVTNLDDFFTYSGGLTTPPCSEVVIWNLLGNTVKISEEQMSEFRKISESEEGEINDSHQGIIEFNYRPIQALNGRTIRRSYEPFGFGSFPGNNVAVGATTVKQMVESSAKSITISFIALTSVLLLNIV